DIILFGIAGGNQLVAFQDVQDRMLPIAGIGQRTGAIELQVGDVAFLIAAGGVDVQVFDPVRPGALQIPEVDGVLLGFKNRAGGEAKESEYLDRLGENADTMK